MTVVVVLAFAAGGCPKSPAPAGKPENTPESGNIPEKVPEFAIEPQFDDAEVFGEGLARVKAGGVWGYIDETGAYVIQPVYEEAQGFSDGMAAVKYNGKWGYIKNPQK